MLSYTPIKTGVGKTTLTRYLYEHERIRANFGDKKILIICGESESFEITGLLNQMVESVTSDESKLSNRDAIIGKLGKNLEGKKLLLVFDDVWNNKQDSWRCLEGWLNKIGTLPGSVMLINTRSDEVAKAAGAVFKLKLEGLSADQSWSLLQKIVSNNNTQPINPSMEEVGRKIVEKCKGVPLAIKVIAGILQSKYDLDKWRSIEKGHIWDTRHGRRLILPTLLPSFHQLPSPSIKQCFAYCAIIPRGNYLFKSELISLWSSQGYLRDDTRKNMTAEEIGEENLNILLSNSLLKCVTTNYGILGYLMHELVYDLAVYVCGSDLIKEAQDLQEIGSCRHLVFESLENGSEIAFPPEKALTKLRTLSLKGNDIPLNILIHSRYLRTLKLDGTGITELPPAVMMLKHLRFLDVSYNPISTLPDSIAQLHQLQTLILKGCRNMEMLPEVLYKLANLRHVLTTSPMLAWRGLQQLTNLQNMASLSLDNDEVRWMRDDYQDLHQLGDTVQYVKDDIKACKVTELNFLWAKEIRENGEGISDEDELEALEPHPNITSLEVENFTGVRFPKWIMAMAVLTEGPSGNRTQLNDLTTIKLLNCSRCQTLPKLGQLPHLKCLVLSELYVEIIGIEFYGGDDLAMPEVVSFNSLRELEISKFRRITTWREPPKEAFPSLETLRIKDCSLLESLPMFEFKSLVTLELENLNSVESIDIIKYSLGLISLTMDGLPKIGSLPHELANCTKLQKLHISNFQKLASLPSGLESLTNLQSLRVANGAAMNFVMNDVLHIHTFLRTFQSVDFLWVKEIGEIRETICDEDDVEAQEPHPAITSLEVRNFTGERFPKWIMAMAVLTKTKASRTQLNNLHTVKLLNCGRCETLPKLGQLPLLKFLTLSGFDVEIIGIKFYGGDDLVRAKVVSFKSLQELEISGFRRLATWRQPPKAAFPSLETLRIKDCSLLETVPAFEFKSLTDLELSHLHSLESVDIIKYNSGLTSIIMKGLLKIGSLPQELINCSQLQTLHISSFGKLAYLPTGLEALVNLQSLKVAFCSVLNFIMDDILHIRSSLSNLEIINCPNLGTIPSSLEECIMLKTLIIKECPMIKGSHTNLSKLRRLWELRMSFRSVEQLRCVLESAKDLPLLRRLEIDGFRNEKEMMDYFSDMTPFLNLPSLAVLMLSGHPNIKTLPKQLGMLTRITALEIWDFDDLEESPSWICNLTSLRSLIFEECENLKGLPSKEDMLCLTSLRIANCPLLVGRYAKDGGSEWDNISHIREIEINGKIIQDLD